MRYVELPGQPSGKDEDAEQPFTPQMGGPAADPGEHRFASRLRDTLDARHARQAAHQADLRLADASDPRSARKEGGRQAMIFLGSLLCDDRMMIRGYTWARPCTATATCGGQRNSTTAPGRASARFTLAIRPAARRARSSIRQRTSLSSSCAHLAPRSRCCASSC